MRVTGSFFSSTGLTRFVGAALLAGLLAGCQADEIGYGPKHLRDVSSETKAEMAELGMDKYAPVLMRIFKEENKFEVWKKTRDGRYALLKSYDICKWSGNLGPKFKEGDRQAPEGYYTITPGLMNPNSQYFLAFNTGFPNAYDRANGRTGTHLMVHGACSSRGCYAMSDEQIQEIYALARDAFKGGQKSFQLQAYPFRMTAENMGRHWDNPHMPFWKMLKEGYDTFELTRLEPKVDVCGRKYVFNATPKGDMSPVEACPELVKPPELEVALARKAAEDEAKAEIVFAGLQLERKAKEEREIMVAQRLEEERRRAEERANQPQGTALASLFGLGSTTPEPADAAPVAAVVDPVVTASTGDPVPRPDPRGPSATALAMTGQSPGQGSMFTRLFSFGDEPVAAPPPMTAAAPIEVAPAAPSPVSTAAVPAAAARPVVEPTAGGPVPAAPAAATATVAPLVPAPGPVPAVEAPSVDTPTEVAATAPVLPTTVSEQQSIIDRIGNWF